MKFTFCSRPSIEGRCGRLARAVFLLAAATLPLGRASMAQVSYLARFTLEKESVLLGEPIFCDFALQNTGTRGFTFSYRLPDRVLNRELEQEPHFTVMDEKGNRLRDPAPHPCGG